ncbi:MAG: PepSY domain-containing protein [Caulobacteraceae bacterium]|nr:PepSY domain-containing protein [Caulobacteraceae bacterium]
MSGMTRGRLRRLWLNVHLWIGVGLLAAIVPLTVSGAAIMWRAELDRVLAPQRFAFAPSAAIAPVSAYVSAAERAFDGRLAPMQVVFPEHAGDPVQVMGAPAGVARKSAKLLAAWLDPATAVVIDKGDPQAGVLGALNVVHKTLLLPVVGHDAVGWAGLALLASCVSGLWLWWPRKGGPLKGLRWTRGASQLFNLHHMVGVCAGLPLALAALTGVYLAFPGVVATLFGAAAPPQPAPRMLHVGPIATADDALAAARGAAGGASPTWMALPTDSSAPTWTIQMAQAGGRDHLEVEVRGRTGEVQVTPATDDVVSYWTARLHEGVDMPVAWRLAQTLAGLAPLLLAGTGVVMWLRRRTRRLELS